MNTKRIEQAIENGIVNVIQKGDPFTIPYESRIDVSGEMRIAYELIDFTRLQTRITVLLEEELAQKIVNKVITEMGTDIKKLMENATIRDDFRFMLRKGVESILEKIKEPKP